MGQPLNTESPACGLSELNAGLGDDAEMTCGNCAQRIGEECEAHGGREVCADDDKPDWCDEWASRA